jgi:glycosyltransferase involved in cell wall biosynthesis
MVRMLDNGTTASKLYPAPIGRSRILCLSFSDLHSDPRVYRQIALLSPEYDVTAAGFTDPQISGVRFVDISVPRKTRRQHAVAAVRLQLRRYESYYWDVGQVAAAHRALAGGAYDLIVANESDTWPLAFALREPGSARVLLDAHEYAPREFEDVRRWRWLYQRYRRHLCATMLPRADAVTTVCEGVAAEYDRRFGVRPTVIMNASPLRDFTPSQVEGDRVRMVHHGVAIRSRRLENMILALDHLDERFSLDLMLVGDDVSYLAFLRELAESRPRVGFRPAVPARRLPEETRDYDVGLFLLEPTNFNYAHALPNKFFEFIQARLAVAIGPSPEMARLVREFDCGVVAGDFRPESLARELGALTPESLTQLKQNAHRAADALSWERESLKLLDLVRRLLGEHG